MTPTQIFACPTGSEKNQNGLLGSGLRAIGSRTVLLPPTPLLASRAPGDWEQVSLQGGDPCVCTALDGKGELINQLRENDRNLVLGVRGKKSCARERGTSESKNRGARSRPDFNATGNRTRERRSAGEMEILRTRPEHFYRKGRRARGKACARRDDRTPTGRRGRRRRIPP